MSFESSLYDKAINKKTKPDEKLAIVNNIQLDVTDEFKLKLISYLLTLSGDRNQDVSDKAIFIL